MKLSGIVPPPAPALPQTLRMHSPARRTLWKADTRSSAAMNAPHTLCKSSSSGQMHGDASTRLTPWKASPRKPDTSSSALVWLGSAWSILDSEPPPTLACAVVRRYGRQAQRGERLRKD